MKEILLILCFFTGLFAYAQDDLLDELSEGISEETIVDATFKGLKIVNFESTKLAEENALYFLVAHRFGSVKNGIDDFFGLDNAVTQIKFIYGIKEWLNIGVARSSFQKKYGGHIKYRLLRQEVNKFPFTVVGYNLVTINTALDKEQFKNLKFEDRLVYTSQLLISRKISNSLSLEVIPTYIHENLASRSFLTVSENNVQFFDEQNDQFAIGVGGRYKLTTRWSLNVDYGIHLNRNENSVFRNPLSIGVDLETGGHVFQMHFTNAQDMFEDGFIVNAQGDWTDGDFFFGFNISRVF